MAYIGNSPGVSSQRIVTTVTATAGQTTFTPSSGYTVGYLDVYLNGIKLINGTDYTASNGSTVVLTDAAALDDVVELMAYIPRGLSDGYTKSEADARYDATGAASAAQSAAQTYAAGLVDDLSGVTNASSARTNLGLGSLATKSTVGTTDITDGAVTAAKLAAGAAVPSQTGQSGKYLTTDGTTASWGTITQPTPAAVSDQANTSTGYFDLPAGTTAQRPASGSAGMVRFNTTNGEPEWYDVTNSAWRSFSFSPVYTIEVLVVAGGGGGGIDGGGGGGAGGVLYTTATAITGSSTFSVVVGGGGGPATGYGVYPSNGTNSSFGAAATALGGGAASMCDSSYNPYTASSGGSGGGGMSTNSGRASNGGAGTSGQGYAGGNGNGAGQWDGAGGGGAGGAGQANGSNSGGNGGVGTAEYSTWGAATSSGQNVSGTYYYAGGGGGANEAATSPGSGGYGGGGTGGYSGNGWGVAGSANTGGGAGGSDSIGSSGGSGGSGIVIVRYLGSQLGSGGTVYNSGGYTYHKFTTSGTFTA